MKMETYLYEKAILEEHVFTFIYGCALKDAVLQKAFSGKKAWIGKEVPEAKAHVRAYIDRVLSGEFREASDAAKRAHDEALLSAAIAVCEAIKGYKDKHANADEFSFGNAQKLINMTVKHIYAHTYSVPDLRDCFRYCHAPMDSIMLSKVWRMVGKKLGKSERAKRLGENFLSPWGREEFAENGEGCSNFSERYLNFQAAIRKLIEEEKGDLFPVEFDYVFWNPDQE